MLEDSCQVARLAAFTRKRSPDLDCTFRTQTSLYHGGYEKDLSAALRYDPEGGRLEADPIAGQRCPPF